MNHPTQSWRSRPVGATAVRLAVFVVPIAVSIGTSIATVRLLPREPGGANLAMRWGVALIVSTIALHFADRFARRFLPLAVLLNLSLAFPDAVPSRFRLARRAASTRGLARIVERARSGEAPPAPALAAVEILALVSAVEAHDRGTRGHSERVRVYTDMISDQLRMSKRDRDRLRWAALLHDVGKLVVPSALLTKPGAPDAAEWAVLHRHPEEGARLTATLRPWLGEWADAISEHHERWDGAGYPKGLAGGRISFGARIVAVADSYETMTARRPYRKPLRAAQARAELVRCSGSQFDPAIVRAFLQVSVVRLQRVGGPLAWLAQTPLIRGVEQVATSGAAAVGGTALALGMVPAPPPAVEAPRPRPVVVSTPAAGRQQSPIGAVVSSGRARPVPGVSTQDPSETPSPSPTASTSESPGPTPPVDPSPTTDHSPRPLPSTLPSREG